MPFCIAPTGCALEVPRLVLAEHAVERRIISGIAHMDRPDQINILAGIGHPAGRQIGKLPGHPLRHVPHDSYLEGLRFALGIGGIADPLAAQRRVIGTQLRFQAQLGSRPSGGKHEKLPQ